MAWLNSWISWPCIVSYTIMLALFPTGRDLSHVRQALVGTGAVAAVLVTTGAAIGPAGDLVFSLGSALFGGSLVAAIVVLVVRVRRSAGVEREQLKWVIYAVSLLAVAGPAAILFYADGALVQIVIAVVAEAPAPGLGRDRQPSPWLG